MFSTLRRIVTGHNAHGKSIVEIDGAPANMIEANGSGLAEIWVTPKVPAPDNTKLDDLAKGDIALEPPRGGVKVRWFAVPPESGMNDLSDEEKEAAAAFAFAAVKAEGARVDTSRHPMMHKTETVDYIILLRGEVTLLLDEDERDLKPGDVVVQRGTNHAWINRGKESAILIAVLIDAEK